MKNNNEVSAGNFKSNKTVVVSGGFDPIHIGHIRMIQEAAKLGDVAVLVNNDNWLMKKKGFVFMPEVERLEIVEAIKGVYMAIPTKHPANPKDMSVCEELRLMKPDVFANGGDRKADNIPEYKLCEELGIEMIFNVGGSKIQSSSELVAKKERDTK